MGQLPLDVAGVVSVWMEVLLYGIYCSLFFESVYIIMKRKRTKTVNSKIFFGATLVMFIFITVHIALNLYRLLRGYVWLAANPGPVAYFNDLGRWDNIAHDAINAVVTWIGDSLVIYRCLIVWQYNYYVIILPAILLILSIIANSIALHLFTLVKLGAIFSPSLVHWMNTIYALAFVQNTMTTALIAYRIWTQDLETRRALRLTSSMRKGGQSLLPVVRVIVESAMIYVMEVLVLIILYALNHNGQYVVQEAIVPTHLQTGIVFTLITVRIAMRSSRSMRPTTSPRITRPLELRVRTPTDMDTFTTGAMGMDTKDNAITFERAVDTPAKSSSVGSPLEHLLTSPGEMDIDRERSANDANA
ncbi:hypothetical protein NEOLEDRAFT_1174421 [Neolentinus lepideus HHB14362 ss-1]|uniref:Uncharacterized protein n=1 Tax=Neolentinus lepideus HHB14362 ss-1 TaxID=1314782 RepID=A0A165VRM0_9AGAM|nr:hypothetical protein NEOLEDRAFT_1174421 [Neolentinus lepideus HHB14362 ss-1]